MTQTRQPIGLIPDLPRDIKAVDKDGNLTPDFQVFLDHLILTLQIFFKTEGFLIPQQTAADIAKLTGPTSFRNIIYDSTGNEFDGNVQMTINNPTPPFMPPEIIKQFWFPFVQIQESVVNPNGIKAGNLHQLCLDTVAKVLYICTKTGTETTAVWTAV